MTTDRVTIAEVAEALHHVEGAVVEMPPALETLLRHHTINGEAERANREAWRLAHEAAPCDVWYPYLGSMATSEQRADRAERLRAAHGGVTEIEKERQRCKDEARERMRSREQRRKAAASGGRVRRFTR